MAARGRGGSGSSSYAAALVIFVILFVFAAILAVVFKTQVTAAQVEAQQATQRLAQLVKPSEMNQPEVASRLGTEAGSVVGGLIAEAEELKSLINASPKATTESIRKEMETLGVGTGQNLLGEVRRLQAELSAAEHLAAQTQVKLQELQKRMAGSEAMVGTQAQAYQQAVDQLKADLASMQEGTAQYQAQVDKQRQELLQEVRVAQERATESARQMQDLIDQKDQELAVKTQQLEELRRQLAASTGRAVGADTTRDSDGVISAVLPEEGVVYLNRGRLDRVLLGMTFEVFDRRTGVQVDQLGEPRGKATVEVFDLSDSTATARVVRLPRGVALNEGDLVANLVYDPHATPRFYVFGEFDIDHTGQPSSTDRRRIEAMIVQWGGKLSEGMTYNTDFLVLGEEPQLPKPLPPEVIDPKKIEEYFAQVRKYETYQKLISDAKSLSIPVLNQNRFLALVGYYQR